MKKLLSLFGFKSRDAARSAGAGGFAVSRMSADSPATIQDGSDNALRRQLVYVLLRDALRRHGIPAGWIECQMLVVSSRSRGPGMYVRLVLKHWDSRLMDYALAFENALMADIVRFEPTANEWLHGISWQLDFENGTPFTELPDKSFWPAPGTAFGESGRGILTTPASNWPAPGAVFAESGRGILTTPASNWPATPTSPATAAEMAAAARQANAARRAAPGKNSAFGGLDTASQPAPLAESAKPISQVAESPEAQARREAEQDLEKLFAIRDQALGRQAAGDTAPVGYEKTRPSPL